MGKTWCPVAIDGDWTILKHIETDERYRSFTIPAITTEDLIVAFKQSSFFQDLITPKTIAIYVVGSRAIGLDKLTSDLDLIVIMDDPEITKYGKTADTRLLYKGLPVHWKFYSYKELFYIDTTANMLAIFRQQLCYKQPLPVYLNDKGVMLNDYLIKNKSYLTMLGAKLTAFAYKDKLLQYKDRLVLDTEIHKYLYHLVMSNEILSGAPENSMLLCEIKYAKQRDYAQLLAKGLIDILSDKLHKLAIKATNIDYEELRLQTEEVNTAICSIINN